MAKNRNRTRQNHQAAPTSARTTSLATAQFRLCIVWAAGAFCGLGTLIAQTILGAYREFAKDAWALFSPLYISILSVLLGAIVAGAVIAPDAGMEKAIRKGYYAICLYLSIGANAVYVVSLWLQQVIILSHMAATPFEALKLSMLWILPLQGLVSIALGGLFGASHTIKKPD